MVGCKSILNLVELINMNAKLKEKLEKFEGCCEKVEIVEI
jgi:hypothetical protein